MNGSKPGFIHRRWRVALAMAVGMAALVFAHAHGLPPGLSGLIGWNAGGGTYLVPTLWMIWRDDEATVRRRACEDDESRPVTLVIVLSAVVASLAATVVAMHEAKTGGAPWAWVFAISTLILGWIVVQTVFTLHYAHRYFGDGDRDGTIDGGVEFPGQQPTTYHDFVYMAVCIGASAQVSDFNLTTVRFRRLVTQHALVAFFFNTMVLALGINILATLIGR